MTSPTLLLACLLVPLPAADPPAPDVAPAPAWDVTAPPGAGKDVAIDVTEGTWMNVDVSPDGRTVVFDLLGDLYTLPITGGDATRLTSGLAWDMQPRFSPDGSRIAYTSDAGGGDNLWVMDADGGNARAVTDESFRLVSSPCWTPDGEYLVGRKHFTARRSLGAGEMWIWHVSGGKGLRMTERPNDQKDVGEPALSPDGRHLYFSRDATPGRTFSYNKDSNDQIYVIERLDRETGEVVQLVTGPGGAVRPTPSPDGKSLAFLRRVRFQTTLFLQDLASGAARPLCDAMERDMQETWAIHGTYPTMAWTPDGAGLVFWTGGRLCRLDVQSGALTDIPFHVKDSREVRAALRFQRAAAPDTFQVKVLRWVRVAPDGGRVVYQALGHLWVKDLPDGTPRRLTQQEDHFEFHPAFSRDGRSIVYTTWNDADLGTVRVVPVAGGPSRVVTTEPGQYVEPVFSPDGAWIVYRKIAGGFLTSPLWAREPGIYAVATAAGAAPPRRIAKEGSAPQFGARSDRVYLMTVAEQGETDRRALVSVDLTREETRTHLVSDWATEYAVAPDGRYVAFAERYRAYVTPLVDTGREVHVGPKDEALPVARISRDAGENLQWSGDSRTIHWSLGPELFSRALTDAFAFLDGAPDPLPEPPVHGRDIGFEVAADRPDGALALVGGRLVTMQGDLVIEDGTIVVRQNRIEAVGARGDVPVPDDARVVDVTGTTILPGLIDVHAHGGHAVEGITPQRNWIHYAELAFGVTTTHDPSHDTNSIFAVSELARTGAIRSPRTFSTGTILYGAEGSYRAEIDSLDDARSHLRRLQAVGAFSVKSYNQPRRDQRQQVIEAARELEMLVVPEGGSTFMHNLTMVVDGHTGIEHSLPVERVYADVAQLWGATDVGYTPTLIVGYGGIFGENYWYDVTDVWTNERLMRFVPRFVVDPRARRRTKAPEEEYNVLRSAAICRALQDAGVQCQLGAHGQLAGLGAHWELWLLQMGGLTNHEALRAATLAGARYLGLDRDLGSLEPGKLADLIVLEQNPLEDIRHSESIRFTMLNGRLHDARTMIPFESDEEPPTFFWTGMQHGLPAQSAIGGCAACPGDAGH